MKLAEALKERSDCIKKIDMLRARLRNNCLVQEGEEPDEDPQALLQEHDGTVARLEQLMSAINRANSTTLAEGKTVTEWIARKDTLDMQHRSYRQLIEAASEKVDRARGSEIRIRSTVNVRELQKKADRLAAEYRRIDNLLQQTNWNTEIDGL